MKFFVTAKPDFEMEIKKDRKVRMLKGVVTGVHDEDAVFLRQCLKMHHLVEVVGYKDNEFKSLQVDTQAMDKIQQEKCKRSKEDIKKIREAELQRRRDAAKKGLEGGWLDGAR